MKKILSVTDFSMAAFTAGRYAHMLAMHCHSELLLLHVFKPEPEIPESYWLFKPKQPGEHWLRMVKREAYRINSRRKVSTESFVAHGLTTDTILTEAKRKKCDLLVCGMKGKGKFLRKIFGSTATKLAEKSGLPLLIVPEKASLQKPRKMLLAVDLHREPFADQLDTLEELGKQFNVQLSVISIINEEDQNASQLRLTHSGFMDKLKSLQPSFTVSEGSDVCKELNNFISEEKPDMLVLLSHHHRFTEKILAENVAQRMSFLTKIPLLLLPEKGPVPSASLSYEDINKTLS